MFQAVFERIKTLAKKLADARADAGQLDAKAVHDSRVTARRLRSALSGFKAILPRKPRQRAEDGLKDLTDALGASREWDVHAEQIDRLRFSSADDIEKAALEFVAIEIDEKRRKARKKMRRQIERLDLDDLQETLARLSGGLRRLPGESLAGLVWPSVEKRIHAALDDIPTLRQTEDGQRLHKTRIAVKKLRYLLENVQAGLLADTESFAAAMKRVQEVLGHYHDLELLVKLLDERATRLSDAGRDLLARGCFTAAERARLERQASYGAFQRTSANIAADDFLHGLRNLLGLGDSQNQSAAVGAGG